MPRLAYVNGRYLPHPHAMVHIEDRGYQFADGVYEVVAIVNGRLADFDGHMARLDRSLNELRIARPMSPAAINAIIHHLIWQNRVGTGLLYIQITRGVAPRDFKFPSGTLRPSIVMTTRHVTAFSTPAQIERGVAAITIPDIRWLRRDIKSVSLLPQVLGKQQAVEAGAYEAWMVDADGMVTEGCSSNAWIVTAEGTLVTRHADNLILNGITRRSLLQIAERLEIPVEIRAFSVSEARMAREAFLSSASTFALPITRLDGEPIGAGVPGPITRRLRAAYLETECTVTP
ncbi:MAG: D-amino-acid transaminase [Rhodospirillaceae bacterium]